MTDDLRRRIEEASPIRSKALLRAFLGNASTSGGPYTHTFTPTDPYRHEFDPQTDAEWQFAEWWDENDAEAALLSRLGPPDSFTLTVDADRHPTWTFTYDREARP